MRIRNPLHSFAVSIAILRLAALLVPRRKREEWLAEWKSELWHIWQMCHQGPNPSLRDRKEAAAFCLFPTTFAIYPFRTNFLATLLERGVQNLQK